MKHTIKYMILLTALLLGVVNEAQATLSEDSIKIVKLPAGNTSTVTVKAFDGRKVTITISPAAGFYVNKTDIVVEKLAYLPPSASSAPRRAVPMAEPIPLESGPDVNGSTGDYVFTVPEGYAGAQVTVTFSAKTAATATVKANDLTYNQAAQPLVIETADGCTVQYKVDDDATFTDGVPTRTNVKRTSGEVGKYKVYYQLVPDAQHTAAAFDATNDFVEVEMKPAKLTKVTLKTTAKKKAEGALTFEVDKVYAGEMEVPSTDYVVTGNTATEIGSYTATVTGKNNYEGTATANYQIVGNTVVLIDGSTTKSDITDLAGTYVLACDVEASIFDNLSSGEFTGTLDGDMYTISTLTKPLFATAQDATIKNVMLKNVKINQDGPVGALVGEVKGYTRIYNCGILPTNNKYIASEEVSYVNSSGGTNSYCGGLVGWLKDDSRVINCFNYANITGGADVAGIVGHNEAGSTTAESTVSGKKYYSKLRTAVVNCMFYGNITGGTNRYPVYGGAMMQNNIDNGINNYDFYRSEASLGLADDSHYNCSWPALEDYLTHHEFYRRLLNSNRELCGWWVGAPSAPSQMLTTEVQAVPKDASLMAKWVLDPSIAPYPILKSPGKYFSEVNQDPDYRVNPEDKTWVSRLTSSNNIMTKNKPDTEGQKLGSVTVTINKGGSLTGSETKVIPITAMDIHNNDYCYGKIQLPYYNTVFGNPSVQINPSASATEQASQWNSRYGGNYTAKVVVGWTISTSDGIAGITNSQKTENEVVVYDHRYSTDAESGYNFADRYCTTKDEKRVFAQGGYYYVPYGVSNITITAKWADAIYLDNSAYHDYDCVRMSAASTGKRFLPAGTRPTTLANGQTVVTGTIQGNIPDGGSVYDNAIVLVGNHQYKAGGIHIRKSNSDNTSGCTIMSADFDLDEEPDYCLIWQLGTGTNRYSICPVRFDFLPVVEIGLAMKQNASTQYYSLGCYRPLGHFEVTETSLIHFGQFEYSNKDRTTNAPLILNGGIFDQYTKGTNGNAFSTADDKIDYIIIGGNVRIPSFTPGAHVNSNAAFPTRHCPVNAIGGNIDYLYLTGNFNENVKPNTDNPHCYIDGGSYKQVAAAAKEGINGDVFFKMDHAVIQEFYGGSTMDKADGTNFKIVKGNIDVTINNSMVTKYCGGPKFGDMILDQSNPANNKTITTNATGTTFGVYFGGGNGGTSYVQYDKSDVTVNDATKVMEGEPADGFYSWTSSGNGKLGNYTPGTYRGTANKNYMADYDMEIVNTSTGTDEKKGVFRTYFHAAQFSATNTGPITNNLTDCKVLTNFYGGGNLGGVKGDVTSTLSGSTLVEGSVFGAGYSASVPEVTIYNKDKTYPTLNVYTGIITPTPESSGTSTTYTWTNETSLGGKTLSVNAPAVTDVDGKNYFYTEVSLKDLGTVTGSVTLNIEGSTVVTCDVFGGGESSNTAGSVRVNFKSGTARNVYGGGSMANVGGDTEVNLMGGTISGNVFGGGKGDDGHSATVGNTLVKLNEPVVDDKGEKTYPYDCEVKGNIFGCNDVNGTPLGNASVFIYKTAGGSVTKKADLDNETATHSYQLKAVYGGGNLAAYIPSAANMETATTRVVIDGCDMTSIQQVYGGGNAASTPATKVEVLGTYEIEEVFGGGNGKDDITVGSETKRNPGANVGYESYALYDDDGSVTEESNATTVEERKAYYQYGSGKASVNIYGGLVHRVFGGSNTLGNVREVAVTLLDGQETCDFQIDEAYGGGKSAPMDGAAQLVMACIPGLKAAYGGAEEADINDDVTLNITNGTFDRVFGGNNVQGTIHGKITVNIEETGCHPIIIRQLYGGGNQAPYEATNPADGPTLNIKSFTSIGDVYGGGYGKTAKVTGDTHVNINVGLGDFAGQDIDDALLKEQTITFTEYKRVEDEDAADYGAFIIEDGVRASESKHIDVFLPLHEPNRIGAIQNVFGGGNQAKVVGSTYVNIGTEDSVILETKTDNTKEGEDKRVVLEVKGADIRGNVYGGGNQAEVTGSTNVVIGKKTAE